MFGSKLTRVDPEALSMHARTSVAHGSRNSPSDPACSAG
jgi:hypothetical protein